MLPSNLLVVWKRKGEILPRYAKLSANNLDASARLIESYSKNIGEKKKVLRATAVELENNGFDYRFVRGLALLLERKVVSTVKARLTLLI